MTSSNTFKAPFQILEKGPEKLYAVVDHIGWSAYTPEGQDDWGFELSSVEAIPPGNLNSAYLTPITLRDACRVCRQFKVTDDGAVLQCLWIWNGTKHERVAL